jgi:predicted nucleic acid-binding protein
LEVLVMPLRRGDERFAHDYNEFLVSSPNVATVPVSPAIAQTEAELRATTKLKTPDAIQLATALEYQAAAFLTNDRNFGDVSSLEILRVGDLIE